MSDIQQKIAAKIEENDVMLFMKGVPQAPQCGFSGVVVQVLNALDVKFASVNVLEDYEIREGIKDYSAWPTIPQLYVKGEFIGGCDIVREMFQSGELKTLFVEKGLIAA
ncbi:Grx4 family monothiol glutaredoxin [Rhizobium sp. MHM7A]|uniref:Grx4 family monothiol glutaredoxin n=1 Tax=Rhizobium sp. MHM7A TaxID=2583233 RepID=UPI001105865F|nr:Grx4 family monothiol glutaredoxin [Rhizobium sp. MHM7A]TLX15889.1 Grx4 family monothiol glutaredoxin [Rhizobium sp. MHM7A]